MMIVIIMIVIMMIVRVTLYSVKKDSDDFDNLKLFAGTINNDDDDNVNHGSYDDNNTTYKMVILFHFTNTTITIPVN